MSRRKPGPQLTVVRSDGRMRNVRPGGVRSGFPAGELPSRVYFSRGSSTPTGTGLNTLWGYAQWLAASRARKLHVLGHANRQPWPAATRNLADARSRAVRDLLVWLGARPGQVRRVQLPESHGVRAATVSSEPAEQRYVELIAIPGRGPAKQMALPGRARRRIAA